VIKDLIFNINSHSFDEVMVNKPYINVSYDGTNLIGNLMNASSNPTQATISILDKTYQVAIVNNSFTLPVKFHPSIAQVKVSLSIRIDGFPLTMIEIGGNNGSISVAIYQDSNGIYQIAPTKSIDLANYYQNSLVDMSFANVDLATADGIVMHTLFHYVIPALNLTLTQQEQDAITEIQNNLLPSIPTNLGNLINGANLDLHYLSYKTHIQQAKEAMDKYIADRIEISKYITLI
jgi:hypothetical protein